MTEPALRPPRQQDSKLEELSRLLTASHSLYDLLTVKAKVYTFRFFQSRKNKTRQKSEVVLFIRKHPLHIQTCYVTQILHNTGFTEVARAVCVRAVLFIL
ncbi:hypothetical protein JOB18_025362 [Solea senegalensis]|uniref:Uncharacterized protein n=1 Tax=Solea senegalensis TaxID=28829 RepID=A0AAV6QME8_SOLSE|nr:hypothetical protein JOB18_025362 [Solea senegalensis]